MRVYRIKFGENGTSYTDDAKVVTDSLETALLLAQKFARKNIKEDDENFGIDKNSDYTAEEQRAEWHSDAIKSWEITSIIFEMEITSI